MPATTTPPLNPTGVDLRAPVVARHHLDIAARLDDVWRLHTDVDGWPAWQPDITMARGDGAFAPGGSFAWETFGLEISSRIYRVDAASDTERGTLWGGPARGIVGLHAWTFLAVPGGVRVYTEESWSGPPVEADVTAMQTALDASLLSWLRHLKDAAERHGA